MINRLFVFFGMSSVAVLLFSCAQRQHNTSTLELTNTSSVDVKEYPIKVPLAQLHAAGTGKFPLLLSDQGDTLVAQLDDVQGDGVPDELFFLVDMKAHTKHILNFSWIDDSLQFPARTRVRHGVRKAMDDTVRRSRSGVFLPHDLPLVTGFQPFQTDGPSWENDKVGFRHYLDGRNSKDVFGKKISQMAPRNVGINRDGVTEDNYHVMEEWGRDILAVGNSLGIGGVSLLIGKDSLFRMGSVEGDTLGPIDRTVFNVYAEGPVRSILNVDYKGWKLPSGRRYDAQETVEIWPGMYGFKNTVTYKGLKGDEKLVVGLVNSRTDKPLKVLELNDQWVVLHTHDKQTYEKEWYLGLALVVPKAVYEGYIKAPSQGRLATTYLAKLKLQADQPISYYAIACWELRDADFQSEKYFEDYLRGLVQQLSAQISLTIHEKK